MTEDRKQIHELALFAGAGGGILGGKLLGWRTVCAVERDALAAAVLAQRQNDGCLEPFPIWSDVETFDGRPWRGVVDVVSGGFPCQDISLAGKGAGIEGKRSGLWQHMQRIVGEVGPRYVLVENSPALTGRGLGTVLGDLAALGYDAQWGVLGAEDAIWLGGNPCADHERKRIWIVGALSDAHRWWQRSLRWDYEGMGGGQQEPAPGALPVPRGIGLEVGEELLAVGPGAFPATAASGGWSVEPGLGRVAHGVAHRVDRLRAIGNGQVPAVVRLAWQILGPDV